jgi:hypothetical protein
MDRVCISNWAEWHFDKTSDIYDVVLIIMVKHIRSVAFYTLLKRCQTFRRIWLLYFLDTQEKTVMTGSSKHQYKSNKLHEATSRKTVRFWQTKNTWMSLHHFTANCQLFSLTFPTTAGYCPNKLEICHGRFFLHLSSHVRSSFEATQCVGKAFSQHDQASNHEGIWRNAVTGWHTQSLYFGSRWNSVVIFTPFYHLWKLAWFNWLESTTGPKKRSVSVPYSNGTVVVRPTATHFNNWRKSP